MSISTFIHRSLYCELVLNRYELIVAREENEDMRRKDQQELEQLATLIQEKLRIKVSAYILPASVYFSASFALSPFPSLLYYYANYVRNKKLIMKTANIKKKGRY